MTLPLPPVSPRCQDDEPLVANEEPFPDDAESALNDFQRIESRDNLYSFQDDNIHFYNLKKLIPDEDSDEDGSFHIHSVIGN